MGTHHRLLSAGRLAELWRQEGLAGLVRGGLRAARRDVVRSRALDLFEIGLAHLDAVAVPLRPAAARIVVVGGSVGEDGEAVRAALRRADPRSERRLAAGAQAVCVAAGDELAHVTWLVASEGQRRASEPIPYPVDFAERQACIPWVFTLDAFRGRGVGGFGFDTALHHLAARGFGSVRFVVRVDNIAMRRLIARYDLHLVARFTALRLLGRELTWPRRRAVAKEE